MKLRLTNGGFGGEVDNGSRSWQLQTLVLMLDEWEVSENVCWCERCCGGRVGANIIFIVCRIMNLLDSPPSLMVLLPHAESVAKCMASTFTPVPC